MRYLSFISIVILLYSSVLSHTKEEDWLQKARDVKQSILVNGLPFQSKIYGKIDYIALLTWAREDGNIHDLASWANVKFSAKDGSETWYLYKYIAGDWTSPCVNGGILKPMNFIGLLLIRINNWNVGMRIIIED